VKSNSLNILSASDTSYFLIKIKLGKWLVFLIEQVCDVFDMFYSSSIYIIIYPIFWGAVKF